MACLVPATAEGLAAGIVRVLDDPDYARRLADTAHVRAEQSYSDASYMARVQGFYRDVLERFPAASTMNPTLY